MLDDKSSSSQEELRLKASFSRHVTCMSLKKNESKFQSTVVLLVDIQIWIHFQAVIKMKIRYF